MLFSSLFDHVFDEFYAFENFSVYVGFGEDQTIQR